MENVISMLGVLARYLQMGFKLTVWYDPTRVARWNAILDNSEIKVQVEDYGIIRVLNRVVAEAAKGDMSKLHESSGQEQAEKAPEVQRQNPLHMPTHDGPTRK
jgi:hypothetical protein